MTKKQGIKVRNKGLNAERELAKLLSHELDIPITNNLLSGVRGEGDLDTPGLHSEVKRQETNKLDLWISEEQPKAEKRDLPFALFHKKNRKPWLVTMLLEDWIAFYRSYIDYFKIN